MAIKIRLLCLATVLAVGLLPAATAQASAYTDVLHAYQLAGTGSIPPCQFSAATLGAALKGVDTYDAQYFQDFTGAIRTALSERAAGACSQSSVAPAPPGRISSLPPIPSGPVPGTTSAGVPAPIILMTVIGVLIALLAAATATVRALGWEPSWAAAWRHAWREAGYRTGGTWAEFSDWLRA